MDKQTVFIKRFPSKGDLPKCKGQSYRVYVITNNGIVYYDKYDGWKRDIEWWLEEIELPSKDEIENMAEEFAFPNSVKIGANFILNHIKGGEK